jgi:hypothetical protein
MSFRLIARLRPRPRSSGRPPLLLLELRLGGAGRSNSVDEINADDPTSSSDSEWLALLSLANAALRFDFPTTPDAGDLLLAGVMS